MRAKNINIEKTNRKKKVGGNACRGSNSRPQTQSCTQAMWTGGLFSFFEKKSIAMHTAHARATHGTQRAQTWMITYPKPVPAQGTPSEIVSYPDPAKNTLSAARTPRAAHCTDRAQTSTTTAVSGRRSSVDHVRTAHVRRDVNEKVPIFH